MAMALVLLAAAVASETRMEELLTLVIAMDAALSLDWDDVPSTGTKQAQEK
jgi:hypothetical protein